MSDNVVKAGIEDVLSSVKRLVSEDGRDGLEMGSREGGRKPGRLVLTDALRINTPVQVEAKPAPLQLKPEYSAEKSAKPMILRACDAVRPETAANLPESKSESQAEEPELDKTADDLTGSLSAKIEALEAAIARTEDQWEPDGDSDDDYSGTPTKSLNWNASSTLSDVAPEDFSEDAIADSAQEAKIEEPVVTFMHAPEPVEAVSEEAAEPLPAKADNEALPPALDEEALTALISDVVRQELQGALGERITRNVRKMVRREIYRALAAQKLD